MPSETTLLFVYGTLKRGDVRAWLLDGQAFLGQAKTLPNYRLFNVGSYPAMINAQPTGLAGLAIEGELWEVGLNCLARLDEEEGVDEGLYMRCRVELDHGQQAWTYLFLQPTEGMADLGTSWPAVRA